MKKEYIWLFFGTFVILSFIGLPFLLELGPGSAVPFLIHEVGLFEREIASGAQKFFEKKIKNHGISNSYFPCSGEGWICAPNYLACERGSIYYSKKQVQVHWKHKCWKLLGVQVTYKHLMQYCYKASGKGKDAKFMIQATGTSSCDKKQERMTIYFDWKGSNGLKYQD